MYETLGKDESIKYRLIFHCNFRPMDRVVFRESVAPFKEDAGTIISSHARVTLQNSFDVEHHIKTDSGKLINIPDMFCFKSKYAMNKAKKAWRKKQ